MLLCRHCQKKKASRPRGLCFSCYGQEGVREKYPSTSKFARLGILDRFGTQPLPTMPTKALPGTTEKVTVLAERAAAGQQLWHPEDARSEENKNWWLIPRLPRVVGNGEWKVEKE